MNSVAITVEDVADSLQYSRREAAEVFAELVAPTQAAFEAWLASHTDHSCAFTNRIGDMDRRKKRADRVHEMTVRALRYLERTWPLGVEPPHQIGFVYFGERLDATGDNFRGVKVGFSTDPVSRFDDHSRSGDLKPLLVVPGSFALERHVHKTLKPWRMPGPSNEWFEPHRQVYALIRWLDQYDTKVRS